MYYLITLNQRIVELWCHAKNFPNAHRRSHDHMTKLAAVPMFDKTTLRNTSQELKANYLDLIMYHSSGGQWLSGRMLDSRPRGREFKPHRRHCVVSLNKNIIVA